MKEESHEEKVGLLFYGSEKPTFWLGLLLFMEEKSWDSYFLQKGSPGLILL